MNKVLRKSFEKELTSSVQIINLDFCDRKVASSASAKVLLMLTREVKSSINRTGLVWGSALDCNLVCDRPEPCYRRGVFIGDDMAI